jgi:hypothetical protein
VSGCDLNEVLNQHAVQELRKPMQILSQIVGYLEELLSELLMNSEPTRSSSDHISLTIYRLAFLCISHSAKLIVTQLVEKPTRNTNNAFLKTTVRNNVSVLGFIVHYLLPGPPLWSSGQSSWLQIRRPGFDSRH